MDRELHKAQLVILRMLRRSKVMRFSDMMRSAGMESDTFKFHVRKLLRYGYVRKLPSGMYELTAPGKEFANNLHEERRTTQKQPKLSVLLVLARENSAGQPTYLFQKRLRQPYYDYWGHISGPVQWGEDMVETASNELYKQTGLKASFVVRKFLRVMDFDKTSDKLLEDKLFAIMEATEISGELTNTWSGGYNEWMTISQLKEKPRCFTLSHDFLDLLSTDDLYVIRRLHYVEDEY